jgi:hypothetical protein
MCDKDSVFMQGLASFQSRSLYSNIINDRTAVYYTTSISRIDPFSKWNAIKVNYLPGLAPVFVDINNPVSAKPQPPEPPSWLSTDLNSAFLRLRLGLFFAIFIPIGSVLFLINAAIQNVRSSQRIRAHTGGNTYRSYEVPLIMDRMRETVEGLREQTEEMFERVNNAHTNEYLADENEEERALLDDGSKPDANGVNVDRFMKVGKLEFPTLALTSEQFEMIEALDDVGWSKFPVHINKARHSHAAIIVRMDRESFSEGKMIVNHFLDRFEV